MRKNIAGVVVVLILGLLLGCNADSEDRRAADASGRDKEPTEDVSPPPIDPQTPTRLPETTPDSVSPIFEPPTRIVEPAPPIIEPSPALEPKFAEPKFAEPKLAEPKFAPDGERIYSLSSEPPRPRMLRSDPEPTPMTIDGQPKIAPVQPAEMQPLHMSVGDEPTETAGEEPPLDDIEPAVRIPDEQDADAQTITEGENFAQVRVFYGTDRARIESVADESPLRLWRPFFPALGAAVVCFGLVVGACYSQRKALLGGLAALTLLAAAGLGYWGWSQAAELISSQQVAYGRERGVLELGECVVTIPKDHRVGEIESPSILRLEFAEDEKKHVVLKSTTAMDESSFYSNLKNRVAGTPRREVVVFVHGYNVTFEDAARRTAQMAYDLEYEGVPLFYSWPSQGELLRYQMDENNVVWTVPHLKKFLTDVAEKSDAQVVNLIAHSMGNRAMTSALKELSYEQPDRAPFHQIILAAPDIDAEVFRRDIAPAIVRTGERVTLYASSNDQALIISKQVHGYPRAGESGPNVIVAPGIETIDVSEIDTSLLGHSYYGDSDSILRDLYFLIHHAQPASQRSWLQVVANSQGGYWYFNRQIATATLPALQTTRR